MPTCPCSLVLTAVQALRLEREEKDAAIATANQESTRADKLDKELQVHALPFHTHPAAGGPLRSLCDHGHSSAHMGYCLLIDDGSVKHTKPVALGCAKPWLHTATCSGVAKESHGGLGLTGAVLPGQHACHVRCVYVCVCVQAMLVEHEKSVKKTKHLTDLIESKAQACAAAEAGWQQALQEARNSALAQDQAVGQWKVHSCSMFVPVTLCCAFQSILCNMCTRVPKYSLSRTHPLLESPTPSRMLMLSKAGPCHIQLSFRISRCNVPSLDCNCCAQLAPEVSFER